jgi:hypothetical protein
MEACPEDFSCTWGRPIADVLIRLGKATLNDALLVHALLFLEPKQLGRLDATASYFHAYGDLGRRDLSSSCKHTTAEEDWLRSASLIGRVAREAWQLRLDGRYARDVALDYSDVGAPGPSAALTRRPRMSWPRALQGALLQHRRFHIIERREGAALTDLDGGTVADCRGLTEFLSRDVREGVAVRLRLSAEPRVARVKYIEEGPPRCPVRHCPMVWTANAFYDTYVCYQCNRAVCHPTNHGTGAPVQLRWHCRRHRQDLCCACAPEPREVAATANASPGVLGSGGSAGESGDAAQQYKLSCAEEKLDVLVCVRILSVRPGKHGRPAILRGQVLPNLFSPRVCELVCPGDILSFRRDHVVQVPLCLNAPQFRSRLRPQTWESRYDILSPSVEACFGDAPSVHSDCGRPVLTQHVSGVTDWGGGFLDADQVRDLIAPGDTVRVMLMDYGCCYFYVLAVDTQAPQWLWGELDPVYRLFTSPLPVRAVVRFARAGISEVPLQWNRPELDTAARRLGGAVTVTGMTLADDEQVACEPPGGDESWFDPIAWTLP